MVTVDQAKKRLKIVDSLFKEGAITQAEVLTTQKEISTSEAQIEVKQAEVLEADIRLKQAKRRLDNLQGSAESRVPAEPRGRRTGAMWSKVPWTWARRGPAPHSITAFAS